MNLLSSPTTSSSSSGGLHLYIGSDTSSPTAPTGPLKSSQNSCYKGNSRCHSHRNLLFWHHSCQNRCHSHHKLFKRCQNYRCHSHCTRTHTALRGLTRLLRNNRQNTQNGSTPETVLTSRAYLSRISCPRPRSQPLVYPPPVMPVPTSQPTNLQSQRYGVPTVPPPRPQPPFLQIPPYDRQTSTDNYPCTDPSQRGRLMAIAHEIYPVRSSSMQASCRLMGIRRDHQEDNSPHFPRHG